MRLGSTNHFSLSHVVHCTFFLCAAQLLKLWGSCTQASAAPAATRPLPCGCTHLAMSKQLLLSLPTARPLGSLSPSSVSPAYLAAGLLKAKCCSHVVLLPFDFLVLLLYISFCSAQGTAPRSLDEVLDLHLIDSFKKNRINFDFIFPCFPFTLSCK